jgi:hypothetical protein
VDVLVRQYNNTPSKFLTDFMSAMVKTGSPAAVIWDAD